jgi:hypothetical protein
VTPLGIEGEFFHLVDSAGQFRTLTIREFSRTGIQALFASTPNFVKWAWPRFSKGDEPVLKGFDDDAVKECIFRACSRSGLFVPRDRMRGRGAWRLRGGGLVYHAGEEVWEFDSGPKRFREFATGMREGFFYNRLAQLPAPWTQPLSVDLRRRTIGALFSTVRRWNWERPDVDPSLFLGWIGAAYLGGALRWRPGVLVLGDKGTGKSTLQELLKQLFGDALFHSADATAAGIYQALLYDTLPVALDEAEGGDSRRMQQVIQLWRDASSGSTGRRGGATGVPTEFMMRSSFLFTAINNPITSAQDLSRCAILRLRPLREDQTPPAPIDADVCGRVVLARMMQEWDGFERLYECYSAALGGGGHDYRGKETYASLLACNEMLLGPELAEELAVPLSEDPYFWRDRLAADRLPEVEDAVPNWRACLTWLLTAQVPTWRHGMRTTVGKLLDDLERGADDAGNFFNHDSARKELAAAGLGLELAKDVGVGAHGYVLAIPNSSQLVAEFFKNTQWQGKSGSSGPWKDALRQAPADIVITDRDVNRRYVAGVQLRCCLVVLAKFRSASER